jgi:replicative DNA helicase
MFGIGGRPNHGKSALMGHLVNYIGTNPDPYQAAHALVFTLEMTGLQLVQRAVMTTAGISQQHVRDGMLSDGYSDDVYREDKDDWKKIHGAAAKLMNSRIHIDPSAPLSVADICSRTRRFVRTKRAAADAAYRETLTAHPDPETALAEYQAARLKADRPDVVIFLDYLQLLLPSDPKLPRYLQIKHDCQQLAFLVKELNIAAVVLFQLKDQENEGPDKLPAMSDARESGDIENFMHEMIFVHRRYLYVLDAAKAEQWCTKHETEGRPPWRVGTPKASGMGQRDLVHRMDLVIAKNREGPQGVVVCHFEPSITKFDNWNPKEKLFSNNPEEHEQNPD